MEVDGGRFAFETVSFVEFWRLRGDTHVAYQRAITICPALNSLRTNKEHGIPDPTDS